MLYQEKHIEQYMVTYGVGYRTQLVLYQEKHVEQYMVTYGMGYRTQLVLYQQKTHRTVHGYICRGMYRTQLVLYQLKSHRTLCGFIFGQDVVMQRITIYRTHLISCHALRVDVLFCKGYETMLNCFEQVDLSIILSRHLTI